MKRWHTNKTQPLEAERKEIIIIWKDRGSIFLNRVGVYVASINCFDKLYLINVGLWKDIKKDIKYWAYADRYFEKELSK